MDDSFRLAALANSEDLLRDITKFEHELAKKIGSDVVLVAYTRDRNK